MGIGQGTLGSQGAREQGSKGAGELGNQGAEEKGPRSMTDASTVSLGRTVEASSPRSREGSGMLPSEVLESQPPQFA